MNDTQIAAHLCLQLLVILVVSRIVGAMARRLGQTRAIGEMVAGIVLGPSLLGLAFPEVWNWLFPSLTSEGKAHPSMTVLYAISQLGLILYMFLVGLELDIDVLRVQRRSAIVVSLSGVIAPFILGGVIGLQLWGRRGFFTPQVSPYIAALFLGAATAVTAFPMLARILQEFGISKSSLGTLVLGAAATGDAAAWGLLAIVIAAADATPQTAILAIAGGVAFTALVLTVGRKALVTLQARREADSEATGSALAAAVGIALLAGGITDSIGLHSVFGAFLIGTAMPRNALSKDIDKKLGPFVTAVLLPCFFVYSGLNTRIGLLNSTDLWLTAGLVFVAAVAGKGVACAVAARSAGESWSDSLMIGTLMNARGLVELIILNIGLQKNLITPTLFSIMVLMAVTTTVMVSPLFGYLRRKQGPMVSTASV